MFCLILDVIVYFIVIQDGGLFVFGDNKDGFRNIILRIYYILIQDGGVFYIGVEKCCYKFKVIIILYGKLDEGESMLIFGKKFIGVEVGGILELYGVQKILWMLLVRILNLLGLFFGFYIFEKDFFWGFNVRVID